MTCRSYPRWRGSTKGYLHLLHFVIHVQPDIHFGTIIQYVIPVVHTGAMSKTAELPRQHRHTAGRTAAAAAAAAPTPRGSSSKDTRRDRGSIDK